MATPAFEEIAETFDFLDDWEDRYRHVIELGKAMPPMDAASTQRAVWMLCCLPNGIQAMSQDIPGLVQTSLNLGILTTDEQCVQASFCVRSSVATQKEMLVARLRCLMAQLGGTVAVPPRRLT